MLLTERNTRHVIVLPYFCDEEVERYLRIAQRLAQFPKPAIPCDFLLAASPRTEHSSRLEDAYSQLGTTIPFQCPTQIFGYPEGPTAMFWDCMEFIADQYAGQRGFALWLESDMAPIKSDWIDRLSDEWFQCPELPIMMGCFVPDVYSHTLFRPSTLVVHKHINGGACYSMDFASTMPTEARTGIFDMAVYQYAAKLGRTRRTRQIAFSTTQRVRRDLSDPNKVLLHGFMQDKDLFIDQCLSPLSGLERMLSPLNPAIDQVEAWHRLIKINTSKDKEDRLIALDNVFLSKQKFDAAEARQTRRAA